MKIFQRKTVRSGSNRIRNTKTKIKTVSKCLRWAAGFTVLILLLRHQKQIDTDWKNKI